MRAAHDRQRRAPARSASEDGRGGDAASGLEEKIHLDKQQLRWRVLLRSSPPRLEIRGKDQIGYDGR